MSGSLLSPALFLLLLLLFPESESRATWLGAAPRRGLSDFENGDSGLNVALDGAVVERLPQLGCFEVADVLLELLQSVLIVG